MTKNDILTTLLLLSLSACAYKPPEERTLEIFREQGFSEQDPGRLRMLLREKGAAGLKEADPYSEIVERRRALKLSSAAPAPSFGMLTGIKDGGYCLFRVFKGSPAEKAGLRDRDKLLSVNSQPPGSEGFLKALAGGGQLAIRAARRGSGGVSEFDAAVKAEPFSAPEIFGFYEPGTRTAFVRLGLFYGDSAAIAASGLAGLVKQGARNVVLDLRGNRGGSPAEAADLLTLFARKPGPVLRLASRHELYSRDYLARKAGPFSGFRVAVLVDGGTSMTGEVFAASLKELAGAALVGSRTAGRVSVQKTFPLGEGRGLRLTVARLVTASGADLEGRGVQPDVPAGGGTPAWGAASLLSDKAYSAALESLRGGSRAP
ncbi:MAG: S41 family peptidase [Elusimicrobia bacterium]|nr:S41 family peptidase [Elusimicrobiota bacterium]